MDAAVHGRECDQGRGGSRTAMECSRSDRDHSGGDGGKPARMSGSLPGTQASEHHQLLPHVAVDCRSARLFARDAASDDRRTLR